jgi:NADH:ubiquinone oxidoreductase subunit F (NADH-binding)
MDRSILEGDPHAVIDGMAVAAYATGANYGWFYIRAEYPLAVERVEKAIRQARKNSILGENIMGSGFSFDCEIRLGAGAFVCGEETALIASVEGRRGTPLPRPPYPSSKGLWGKPSCVNNVETLANIPHIINRGAEWYASSGTETSRGTKVFALTGKVKNSGLIEVPMGITLKTVIEEIGGGSSTGKKIKAVQTGGPSGGVIPSSKLDTPICYDKLQELGSIMGSGGMIVLDEDDSMPDIAKFYLEFTVDESCGKCAPCRIGGKQLLELLKKITAGKASMNDISKIKRLCQTMRKASLCGLGQTAPNPVLSTLKYFGNEYLEKISVKKDS